MDLTPLPWLAAFGYLVAATPSLAGLLGRDGVPRTVAGVAVGLALALHLTWLSGQLGEPGPGVAGSLSLAAWTTASASGCSEALSTAAARARTSASLRSPKGTTSLTLSLIHI